MPSAAGLPRLRSRRPAASRRPNALHSRMDGRGPRRDGTPRRPAASGRPRPAASPGGGGGRRSPSLPPHVEEQLAARRPSGPGPAGNPPVVSPRYAAAPSPRQLGRGAAPPPAELPPHLRHLSAGPEGRGRQGQPADQDVGGTERGGFRRPSRSPHSPPAPDHGRRVVMIRWVGGLSAGRVHVWGSGKAGRCLGGWWAAPAMLLGACRVAEFCMWGEAQQAGWLHSCLSGCTHGYQAARHSQRALDCVALLALPSRLLLLTLFHCCSPAPH